MLYPCPIQFFEKVTQGPILGMDWGKKHVGLAVSDKHNFVAVPLEVVAAGAPLRCFLTAYWKKFEVQGLLIGWPLSMDGGESALCTPIKRLAERLGREHGWNIGLWDERLTTKAVRGYLPVEIGSRKYPKRTPLHANAAAIILQGALDRLRHLKNNAPLP